MSKEERKNLLSEDNTNDNISSKQSSFLSLFRYADKQDKGMMVIGSIAAIGAGIASPLFMIFFSTISELFVSGNEENAEGEGRTLFFKLFFVGIMTWICHAIGMWAWSKSGSRQSIRLKKIYYQTLLCQQIAWFDKQDTSKITTQISQNTIYIQTAIGQKISYTITALVTSLFGFVYSFVICWQMSLYLAIFLPFMLLAGFLLMRTMVLKAKTGKISYQNAAGVAQNAFSSIKTIKACVSQKFEIKKFHQQLIECQPKVLRYSLYSSLSSGFMYLIMLGLYSFGFYIGKQMMIGNPGQYRASDIISTFFCFMVAGQSVGQISPIFKNIADAKTAADKIYELINRQQGSIQNDSGEQMQKIKNIKFESVVFSYQSKQDHPKVLNKINIQLKPKTTTAIVGQSGSGKSTIAQLLLRYYDPIYGNVLINNRNLKHYKVYSYRNRVGYVGQEPVLFSMSIKQNIQLVNPNLTNQELILVLKRANAWEFVQKLPEGVNTYVGNRGTQLSGGQKQRIAIARALAKNPDLLILDEATSALDQENERKFQQTMRQLGQSQITVLVIAHRLSTIQNAHNIVVLREGQIAETGTLNELKHNGGYCSRLISSQQTQQLKSSQPLGPSDKQQKMGEIHIQKQSTHPPEHQQVLAKAEKVDLASHTYRKLLSQSKEYRCLLVAGSCFALLNGLVYPFFNVSFSNILSLMSSPQENQSSINMYCLAFLIIAILGSFSNFAHNFMFNIYGQKIVFKLRIKLFRKLIKLPASFYDKKENTPGGISSKLSQDSYQLHNAVTGIMSVLFLNSSTILATLIFAFYFSWKLALIVLVFSPLMAAKGVIAANVLKRMSQKSDEIQKNVGSLISDSICNIRTVKSFGGYGQFTRVVSEKLDHLQCIMSDKSLKMGILQGFSRSSATMVYAIVFWIAAVLFAHNQFDQPRDALVAILCIVFASTTVGQNSQLMPDLAKAEKSSANIFNILETKDQFQIASCFENKQLRGFRLNGTIQFCDVQFSYPERKQKILNNFNLKIKKGQKIGIVGQSGSGKSTIIQILSRLYPIQKGQVLIDGFPIQQYNLRKYRQQLGIVNQQPSLFKGTISENVLYQYLGSNKYGKRLIEYCEVACVNKFMADEPQKYSKEVGERGALVSGGQKQRIALARCLIRRPKIIIMDEPTSALDAETEAEVFKRLYKQVGSRSTVYTTHRLSTVKMADRVLVMSEGCIVQEGSYAELMQRKQKFYTLAAGQKAEAN